MWDFIALGVEHTALAVFCFTVLFTLGRRRLLRPLTMPIAVLGLVVLFRAIVSFTFAAGATPLAADVALVDAALAVCLTLVLGLLVMRLTGHHDIAFLMGFYVISLAVVTVLFSHAVRDAQFLSYFLLVIVFLHLELVGQKDIREAGHFGMAFAGFSALLVLLGQERSLFSLIVALPLFGFLRSLSRGIEAGHATLIAEPPHGPSVLRVLRLIGFTVAFYVFVALAVVGAHEIGHVAVATAYHCEYTKAVIYDPRGMPHAELSCSRPYSDMLLTLGGVIATTAVSMLLLLMPGNAFVYALSFFVMGFGFLVSYSDFSYLAAGKGFLALIHLVGLSFIVLSVVEMTALFRTKAMESRFSLFWEEPAAKSGETFK